MNMVLTSNTSNITMQTNTNYKYKLQIQTINTYQTHQICIAFISLGTEGLHCLGRVLYKCHLCIRVQSIVKHWYENLGPELGVNLVWE